MLHKIMPDVLREIRKYARLGITEAGNAMGRERQIVYRIERGEQLPTREQELALFKRAKVSRHVFVEIMCKSLTKFLGRPVIIAPTGRAFMAASPLARIADYYSSHEEELPQELKERIEAKLRLGRLLDSAADQACSQFEIEIRALIQDALGRRHDR